MLGRRVEYYSGSAPRTAGAGDWEARKRDTAKRFKRNQSPVLVCTKAFGMGIDKPNIRFTVHLGLPNSIEAFYQEAGRAGRDEKRAYCAVIVSNDHPNRNAKLLRPDTQLDELIDAAQNSAWADQDDVTRALWFHTDSFRGELDERNECIRVMEQLGDLSSAHMVRVSYQATSRQIGEWRERVAKALHRLVIIGVVSDYTIDYAAQAFDVRVSGASPEQIIERYSTYAAAYQPRLGQREAVAVSSFATDSSSHREFVIRVVERLIMFVYEHVERARRRSMNEMLSALEQSSSGEELKRRILDYLVSTEFDERLDEIRQSANGGIDVMMPLIEELVTPNDAAALRGSVARLLSSYPDIPGLLFIRSLTEMLSKDRDVDVAIQNIRAAVRFAIEQYGIDPTAVGEAAGQIIAKASPSGETASLFLEACLHASGETREFFVGLIRELPFEQAAFPKSVLLARLIERSQILRRGTRGRDGNNAAVRESAVPQP
jgi:ATP-dependent DNA helicase RecQ